MSKLQVSVTHGILETENLEQIPVGSEEWFDWLEKNKSFRFECDGQGFSARKENPLKKTASDSGYGEPEYDETNAYWSAYRKVDGRTRKRYIGKSATLTHERLIEISKALDEPSAPKPEKELPIRLGDSEVTQLESKAWRLENSYQNALKDIERLESEKAGLHKQLGDCHAKFEQQLAGLHKKLGDSEEKCVALDAENLKLHATNGDALNEIETLKDELATIKRLQSESAAPALDLPDLEEIRDQIISKWRVAPRAESRDRIKQALNKFIEAIHKASPSITDTE